MLFLHTADLHLGRALHDRPLVEDQRRMLEFLLDLLGREDYAGLLVAGDVYDRSIPSPEAVSLLGEFLAAARRRFPDLLIAIISGNHDSPERLAYGDELFAALGIRIVSDPSRSFEPILVEKAGERCALFALPFLIPGSLSAAAAEEQEATPLRSQRDLAAEAAARLGGAAAKARVQGAASTVLMAHLFATGGGETESERVFLGTAERVDAGLFSSFDYVALGHLHRQQKVAGNAWYSGSPLAYSFDEAGREKSFLRVEVGAGAAVTPIPIRPERRVSRLFGSFDSFLEPNAHEDRREDYLEISLSDGHLTENPLAVLRSRYPNLLSVRQDVALAASGIAAETPASARTADRRNADDDFRAFLTEIHGTADEEKTALFKTIAAEAAHETA